MSRFFVIVTLAILLNGCDNSNKSSSNRSEEDSGNINQQSERETNQVCPYNIEEIEISLTKFYRLWCDFYDNMAFYTSLKRLSEYNDNTRYFFEIQALGRKAVTDKRCAMETNVTGLSRLLNHYESEWTRLKRITASSLGRRLSVLPEEEPSPPSPPSEEFRCSDL